MQRGVPGLCVGACDGRYEKCGLAGSHGSTTGPPPVRPGRRRRPGHHGHVPSCPLRRLVTDDAFLRALQEQCDAAGKVAFLRDVTRAELMRFLEVKGVSLVGLRADRAEELLRRAEEVARAELQN